MKRVSNPIEKKERFKTNDEELLEASKGRYDILF